MKLVRHCRINVHTLQVRQFRLQPPLNHRFGA
jgi:hypothetical protein